MTDVLLINGMEYLHNNVLVPYIGHYILEKVLKEEHIDARQLNIDMEIRMGRLHIPDDPDGIFEAAADYILSMSPRVVGFNTICNSFITAVQICMKIHAKAPEVRIIFGGPHATLTAEECLRDLDFLTLVCLGESEYSIVPVIRALLDGTPLDGVPGIAWRKDGKTVLNPCCELVPAERLTDYTVIDYGEDFRSLTVPHSIEGGRGCPFHCTFCSTSIFWQRNFRIKPVEILLGEMDRCHEEMGTVVFAIEHDMFTANRKTIVEFCNRLIERGSPYYWKCSSRVDVLDEELIGLMARAGCVYMFLGIETGSARMQKIIHKNLDLKNAAEMVKCLIRNHYTVSASFIYGFPEETEEDFLESVHMLEEFLLAGVDNLQFHPFMLLPGTEETATVKDRAIFNEREVDLSIYNRRVINEESRELIRKYKDIFIQYYSFDSAVRKKYPWFEVIFAMTSLHWNNYKNTFATLTVKVGLTELYLKYEDLFRDFYYRFNDYDYSDNLLQIIRDALKKIVAAENDEELSEIFRYEDDLFGYAVSDCRDDLIREYRLDIGTDNGNCVYLNEGRQYMFRRGEGTKVRVIRVPGWMTVE